jgi:transposase
MAKRRRNMCEPLDTTWRIPDELWAIIEPMLREFWPRKREGRPPANWRSALDGIIFRMRTGCQWHQLPEEFGRKSTVHDWFQR